MLLARVAALEMAALGSASLVSGSSACTASNSGCRVWPAMPAGAIIDGGDKVLLVREEDDKWCDAGDAQKQHRRCKNTVPRQQSQAVSHVGWL